MIDLCPIREGRKKWSHCTNNFRFARIYFKRGGRGASAVSYAYETNYWI